jgi:predicted Zn-dependent protease with MMP-like domain
VEARIVHPEVVPDLVQHGHPHLRRELVEVARATRQRALEDGDAIGRDAAVAERSAPGQRNPFVQSEQRPARADALARQIENVAVVVEDRPSREQLARLGPGRTLLGLYEGVPLTGRGPLSYIGVVPDRITIFQGPLSHRARDVDELAAQVRVTVLHEVGHYFGMSDARLHELGWA